MNVFDTSMVIRRFDVGRHKGKMALSIVLFAISIGTQDGAFAATMRLKAVAVSDAPIDPTDHVVVMPTDTITVEAYVTGWDEDLAGSQLKTYQFMVDGVNSYFSGDSGRLLLSGVDAPADFFPCQVDGDCAPFGLPCAERYSDNDTAPRMCGYRCFDGQCPADFPECAPTERCVGPDHHPEDFARIDDTRSDFVHYGQDSINAMRTADIDFAFGSTTLNGQGPRDNGTDRYMGEFELIASDDACGEFIVRIVDDRMGVYTFLETVPLPPPPYLVYPDLEPLTIDVYCPPIAACCVPRQACVDRTQADCFARGGLWQQGQLCAQGTQTCPRLPIIHNPGVSGTNTKLSP